MQELKQKMNEKDAFEEEMAALSEYLQVPDRLRL